MYVNRANDFVSFNIMHAIFHVIDWQSASSVLWKVLTDEHCQVDSFDYGQNESTSLRVMAMTRSSLDVVLSVATTVVFTLLLKSGDIEKNPGPGGNEGHREFIIERVCNGSL